MGFDLVAIVCWPLDLGIGDTALNESDERSFCHGTYILVEGEKINMISKLSHVKRAKCYGENKDELGFGECGGGREVWILNKVVRESLTEKVAIE